MFLLVRWLISLSRCLRVLRKGFSWVNCELMW